MTIVSATQSGDECARSSLAKWSIAMPGAVRGTGSSIASILLCASRSPVIRFDMDRLGVGRLSFSSDGCCPLRDVREPFFLSPGDDGGRLFRLIALDARRTF
jgi:hypothetical protein